jgi:hypothetical protein
VSEPEAFAAMTSARMTDDIFVDRTAKPRGGKRRPPIIDQDGNEVHPGGFGGAGRFGAGVDFEQFSGALGGISFGPSRASSALRASRRSQSCSMSPSWCRAPKSATASTA